jgi:hypothetical protein
VVAVAEVGSSLGVSEAGGSVVSAGEVSVGASEVGSSVGGSVVGSGVGDSSAGDSEFGGRAIPESVRVGSAVGSGVSGGGSSVGVSAGASVAVSVGSALASGRVRVGEGVVVRSGRDADAVGRSETLGRAVGSVISSPIPHPARPSAPRERMRPTAADRARVDADGRMGPPGGGGCGRAEPIGRAHLGA